MNDRALIDRIAVLEARARRSNRIGLACVVALGGLALCAMQAATSPVVPETIKAREFVVVDGKGRPVGRWGALGDGIAFQLFIAEASGASRKAVLLRAGDDGGEFWLRGGAEHGVVGMNVRDRGAQLSLYSTCADGQHPEPVSTALVDLRAIGNEGSLEAKRTEVFPSNGVHEASTRALWKTPAAD